MTPEEREAERQQELRRAELARLYLETHHPEKMNDLQENGSQE